MSVFLLWDRMDLALSCLQGDDDDPQDNDDNPQHNYSKDGEMIVPC